MEAKVVKEVIAFEPTEGTESVVGRQAGESGRGWTEQPGIATVKVTTTTVDPDTGEEIVTEEVQEGVLLTQSTNPGGQTVYKGLNEGEDVNERGGRVVDATGRSSTRAKKN